MSFDTSTLPTACELATDAAQGKLPKSKANGYVCYAFRVLEGDHAAVVSLWNWSSEVLLHLIEQLSIPRR